MCLAERLAASVWTCQADIASVHWAKLKHVGMVTSYGLLLLAVIASLALQFVSFKYGLMYPT
jgi:hypothetical protein